MEQYMDNYANIDHGIVYIYIYTDKYQVYGNVYDCSIAYGVWYMVYGNVS